MELLCIKSSHSNYPDAILVHKDCRYNLTGVRYGKTPEGTENPVWYTLLETGIYIHHSSLFVVAPPIIEEVVQEEIKKEII